MGFGTKASSPQRHNKKARLRPCLSVFDVDVDTDVNVERAPPPPPVRRPIAKLLFEIPRRTFCADFNRCSEAPTEPKTAQRVRVVIKIIAKISAVSRARAPAPHFEPDFSGVFLLFPQTSPVFHSFCTTLERFSLADSEEVPQSNPTACVAILDAAVRLRESWRMLAPAIRANHVPHGRWVAECIEYRAFLVNAGLKHFACAEKRRTRCPRATRPGWLARAAFFLNRCWPFVVGRWPNRFREPCSSLFVPLE
jgi:hypothetical protein